MGGSSDDNSKMKKQVIERDEKGIPIKSHIAETAPPTWIFYSMVNLIFGTLGLIVAYYFLAYYSRNSTVQEDKILLLINYELGWFYLGIVVLKVFQIPLFIILGKARRISKIQLPDQQVYKVMGAEGSKLGYVLMENDGPIGDFNRAQRALMNYHEIFPTTALMYVASSFVYPFESFVWITIFALSRCIMSYGYKNSVNGRMFGTLIGLISQNVLQGMVILISFKSLVA